LRFCLTESFSRFAREQFGGLLLNVIDEGFQQGPRSQSLEDITYLPSFRGSQSTHQPSKGC
jgi:hypothetical protein